MDLGKDECHLKQCETPDPHRRETQAPVITGTWILRNREQLRKRKAEAQEKQTSQWLLGEQKKRKWQKTEKGNPRGRRRQQNTKQKGDPQSQTEATEKVLTPLEKDTEPPTSVTEAPPSGLSPQQVVPEEHLPETCKESNRPCAHPSEYQEIVVQSNASKICHNMVEAEDSSKMDQETGVLQDQSSKAHPDTVEPQAPFPPMCQEATVFQDQPCNVHPHKGKPEDLSPKMCPEAITPQTLPSTPSEDTAGLEGCSPEALPKPDVPQDCVLDAYPETAGPEKVGSETDQGITDTKGFFPTAVPKDLSTKIYQEAVEPEYLSDKTGEEIAVPEAPSHKTMQETSASEGYPPAIDQEIPEPKEDAPETYQTTPVSEEYPPATDQETPEPEDDALTTGQETLGQEDDAPETYQTTPMSEEYSPAIGQEVSGPEEYSPAIDQETPGPEDLSVKTHKNKEEVPKECFPASSQETGGPDAQAAGAYQEDAMDVYTFPQEMKEEAPEAAADTAAVPNIAQEIRPENDIYSYVLF
ncbi:hemogen [Ochotona princeps]|uniref:hemogen n=1 Tax=Ochotona princeps TaxID=9978 RepID=UPI00271471A0|nr:hemogen [Ochotona princeps]XP_058528479.1 hemogen [Ochotona princeps]